jgi:phosphatidylinositol-4,5-bisphosphate 3-kinase
MPEAIVKSEKDDADGGGANNMRLKDFLASINSFSNFTDQQLVTLEQKAKVVQFEKDEIVFKQGEEGNNFYVIHNGAADVLIQEDKSLLPQNDLGKAVNRLTSGCYFGERALMNAEPRAASIKVAVDSVCLVFTRAVYEEVISGSNALIGKDVSDHVDLTKDHETRSLLRHVVTILEIDDPSNKSTPMIKELKYKLATALTPELLVDDIVSRMVITIQKAVNAGRVGLFMLNSDRKSMTLKVSERAKEIRLPLKGLAGAIVMENKVINIPDAYQDDRFDSTMDRRTKYTTRQVLGVPVRNPMTGSSIGALQVNNRMDSKTEAFTVEQQKVLELASIELSEVMHHRADFFKDGIEDEKKKEEEDNSKGISTIKSSTLGSQFQIELYSISFGNWGEGFKREWAELHAVEVSVSLYLALSQLCAPQTVPLDTNTYTPLMDMKTQTSMQFNIAVRDLPRAARVLFKLRGRKKNGLMVTLGWAASTVFDFRGSMETMKDVRLFKGDIDAPIKTTLSNMNDSSAPMLSLVLAADLVSASDSSGPKVRIAHHLAAKTEPVIGEDENQTDTDKAELERIKKMSFNPLGLTLISNTDREYMWDMRRQLINRADMLPAFILSMQWRNSDRVQELYSLLDLWQVPSPHQALVLLDRRFMDPKVRAFAVHCLEPLENDELSLYMLQLCQQLKFENYADSALARFLLRRAVRSKNLIGHIFYWQLQSEVHNTDCKRRFTLLLQIYIRNCGSHRIELGRQVFVMNRLTNVAELVCQGNSKAERLEILHSQLKEAVLPLEFQLPLNPHLKVAGIHPERCRVMESKKKPLWLTMHNKEGEDVVLMLKVGDDLRQDALVMQLLRVMNLMWEKEGLDMNMQLYDCISTGDERGLLQVVMNATTVGSILLDATDKKKKAAGQQVKSGSLFRKLSSAMKALSDFSVIRTWIHEQAVAAAGGEEATDEAITKEEDQCIQNFIISTAAYCVASYVLGLGDRHNDNLMITKSGHYFHIDFGHILGNFKSKFGVKREKAPFVFTHSMRAVMDDDQFDMFTELCCDTYNILRQNAAILVSLCSLAIPCELPELQNENDVMWIYEKLLVDATEEEASEHFRKELDIAQGTRMTRINDAAHMLAHA